MWQRRTMHISLEAVRPLKSFFRDKLKGASYCSKRNHSESIGVPAAGALFKEALQTA
jgi:hypothetical protein